MENREEKKWMSKNTCTNLKNNVPHLLPKKKTADGLLQYDSNLMKIKSLEDNFFKNEKIKKKSLQDKQQGPVQHKELYTYIISCDIP